MDAAVPQRLLRYGCGVCTLRAAIQEANALSGADVLLFPPAPTHLTIPGVNEDYNVTGDLYITSNLTSPAPART